MRQHLAGGAVDALRASRRHHLVGRAVDALLHSLRLLKDTRGPVDRLLDRLLSRAARGRRGGIVARLRILCRRIVGHRGVHVPPKCCIGIQAVTHLYRWLATSSSGSIATILAQSSGSSRNCRLLLAVAEMLPQKPAGGACDPLPFRPKMRRLWINSLCCSVDHQSLPLCICMGGARAVAGFPTLMHSSTIIPCLKIHLQATQFMKHCPPLTPPHPTPPHKARCSAVQSLSARNTFRRFRPGGL